MRNEHIMKFYVPNISDTYNIHVPKQNWILNLHNLHLNDKHMETSGNCK